MNDSYGLVIEEATVPAAAPPASSRITCEASARFGGVAMDPEGQFRRGAVTVTATAASGMDQGIVFQFMVHTGAAWQSVECIGVTSAACAAEALEATARGLREGIAAAGDLTRTAIARSRVAL